MVGVGNWVRFLCSILIREWLVSIKFLLYENCDYLGALLPPIAPNGMFSHCSLCTDVISERSFYCVLWRPKFYWLFYLLMESMF